MPTSIREQILAAVATATSAEYGVPAPENERDLPITIMEDGQETVESDAYGHSLVELPVVVASAAVAVDNDGDAMRAQANALLASLVSAMFTDETFGGLAERTEYTAGAIQTEIGKFVFAEAQFLIRYTHLRGDPFTIE